MSVDARRRHAGFTLSELVVGMLLSSIVMAAVLSSYVYVARAYTRTIGFGLPNEPTLESQGRRTLSYFAQDVQMTSAVSGPSESEVTLTVPHPLGGTRDVTYYYNSTAAAVDVYSVTVPATTLVRIDRSTNTLLRLHSSLLTCVFSYYDAKNRTYTAYTDYLVGIKQVALELTAQAGTTASHTMTKVYRLASPRLVVRNKPLLP